MGGGAEQEHLFFRKGSQVEVSSDEDGFRDAWYVATILDVPSKSKKRKRSHNKKYLVEYETLLANDDESKPLRELVDVSFMRPVPPSDDQHPSSFELDDVVDAFYSDGWWIGIITRVDDSHIHSNSDSKFVVFFQNPPDEIEFARSQLRLHRDWVDSKWVMPEKQQVSKQQNVGVQGKQKDILVEMNRRTSKSQVKSSHISATGKSGNAKGLNNQTIIVERKRRPKLGVKTARGSAD